MYGKLQCPLSDPEPEALNPKEGKTAKTKASELLKCNLVVLNCRFLGGNIGINYTKNV